MLKEEFFKKLEEINCAKVPTDEEYKEIEFVYLNNPVISETNGKEQIAELYKIGGMTLIKDMYKRAEVGRKLYDVQQKIQRYQSQCQYAIKALEDGCALDDCQITNVLEIGENL